jgi:hypothetical protein
MLSLRNFVPAPAAARTLVWHESGGGVAVAGTPGRVALMERFIREKPALWAEDIAED